LPAFLIKSLGLNGVMNNQLKTSKITIGLALLTTLMLASCGGKKDEPVASAPENAAASPANPVGASSPAANANGGSISADAQKLGVKPTGATTCPSNAPIKGLSTKKRGNIYHVAKAPDYAKVKPEVCFKDAATAQKAGFSAPK
jgi:hypothetical protein